MSLFNRGSFQLHSGGKTCFKIDCDFMSNEDIEAIAMMLSMILPSFGSVEGVPNGGLKLAQALSSYATVGPHLIVDDVLTTGKSMEAMRKSEYDIGAVIFARKPPASWITPLFHMDDRTI